MAPVRRKDKVPVLVHSISHEDILHGARGSLVRLHEAHFIHRVGAALLPVVDWTDLVAVAVVVGDVVVVGFPGVGHKVAGCHDGRGRGLGHGGQREEHHQQEQGEHQQHQPAVPET